MSKSFIDPRFLDDVRNMPAEAQITWVHLVTNRNSQLVPGLLPIGPQSISEGRGLSLQVIERALKVLIKNNLIERDEHAPLICIPRAPMYYSKPGPNGIKGWHRHWITLPESALKYSHVESLRRAAHLSAKPNQDAWEATFGGAGSRPPSGSHIGSNLELPFSSQTSQADGIPSEGYPDTFGKVSEPHIYGSGDGVGSVYRNVNGDRSGNGVGSGDGGVSSKGSETDSVLPDPELKPVERKKAEGPAAGKIKGVAKDPMPCSVRDLLIALREGSVDRILTEPFVANLAVPITLVIRELAEAKVVLPAEARLVGEYVACGGLAWQEPLGLLWIAKSGNLADAIAKARAWDKGGRPQMNAAKKPKGDHVGYAPPSPHAAFRSGDQ